MFIQQVLRLLAFARVWRRLYADELLEPSSSTNQTAKSLTDNQSIQSIQVHSCKYRLSRSTRLHRPIDSLNCCINCPSTKVRARPCKTNNNHISPLADRVILT